ncbi:MAG: hypothetical protein EZS28_017666 [Streblomastix strix]|uniref:Uncharacterized protein n=1 Tax=Streblomastix strix TaxID=222440 RepID=A0A5J4VW92_9EUKA|nr:MAG: hypothetical protein EZS28_017666 [Streblomastix strix]
MFDCFVDQDVVSAPSDLYHSLTFENLNVDDKKNYYGLIDGEPLETANIFQLTTFVPVNFGFIALSKIENKVYPDSVNVLGSE